MLTFGSERDSVCDREDTGRPKEPKRWMLDGAGTQLDEKEPGIKVKRWSRSEDDAARERICDA